MELVMKHFRKSHASLYGNKIEINNIGNVLKKKITVTTKIMI